MIRAHTAAFKALLEAAGLTVYVTKATGAPPYVVLHPDQGRAESASFNTATDARRWMPVTHSVGTTTEQAQWVAEKVYTALSDVRPTVTGRTTYPIRNDTSINVDRDEDVQPPLFVARDIWALTTLPA